ncbi:hypothetical protein AB4Z09_26325 [Rhodococcus sp. TAF43]|uniref:hypothetical protein n=1 Tax=unclassified Rhodococcus (in: high G+C Gram-positive bacteria) TaxID=192944 RepID=UPI001582356E|nr:hypothetical protein [Rhodococcus sp. W8901]QKT10422.1 hypothetical protein HUN07_06555 [Rhodococcus sp. W8901]
MTSNINFHPIPQSQQATVENFKASIGRYVDTNRVDSIKASHKAQLEAIRKDPRLTAEGKRSELAKAHVASRDQMNELRTQFKTGLAADKLRIQRRLFGSVTADPTDIVSARDAHERASRISSQQDAITLLERAQITGDTALSRAIFHQAARHNWNEAITTHAETSPGAADGLKELRDLPEGDMTENLAFALPLPNEFVGMTAKGVDAELRKYADE